MRKGVTFVFLLLIGWMALADQAPLLAVESVDLERYMGRWFAIASIPTSFERQCAQGTTAEYQLMENGKVQVINTCYDTDGNVDIARGAAWLPNRVESSKLKVSFVKFLGGWWFGAPYWIIDLAADYSFAVVGHPSRTFGWVLCRTPAMPEEVLSGIIERLELQGYRWSEFRMIDQSVNLPEGAS